MATKKKNKQTKAESSYQQPLDQYNLAEMFLRWSSTKIVQ